MGQINVNKRQNFLDAFLKALGVETIRWIDQTDNSVSGTAIYDSTDIDEQQDFIWHMSERNVPDDKVLGLLTHLTDKRLLNVDKIKLPVAEIEIPNCDSQEKERLFDELFRVTVNMVDKGQETDRFFIHD